MFSLETARLNAGASVGTFQERLINIIDEVEQSDGAIIVFFDEFHTLIGGTLDAANILKPALARGVLKATLLLFCITQLLVHL